MYCYLSTKWILLACLICLCPAESMVSSGPLVHKTRHIFIYKIWKFNHPCNCFTGFERFLMSANGHEVGRSQFFLKFQSTHVASCNWSTIALQIYLTLQIYRYIFYLYFILPPSHPFRYGYYFKSSHLFLYIPKIIFHLSHSFLYISFIMSDTYFKVYN